MDPLVVPIGGVFLGSFGEPLLWDQLSLLMACLLILIILESCQGELVVGRHAGYKVFLAHHCCAGLVGLDNHGADLSWSSTLLISVLVQVVERATKPTVISDDGTEVMGTIGGQL